MSLPLHLNYHHHSQQMSGYFDANEEHSLISKLDHTFDAEVTSVQTETATQADDGGAVDTKKLLEDMMAKFEKLVDDKLADAKSDIKADLTPFSQAKTPRHGHNVPRPDTQVINGMVIRRTGRSASELDQSTVVLSRFSRSGKDDAEKRKIRDKHCVALQHKFALINYDKLTDSSTTGSDLGAMVLAQSEARADLEEWCNNYDIMYLFMMPDVNNFEVDPELVPYATKRNLFEDYQDISLPRVKAYEEFIRVWMSDVEIETSSWLLQVLKSSISKEIHANISHDFNSLPLYQRGGFVFFKLLMDTIHKNSDENRELLRDYLKSFKLSSTPGENVTISTNGFIAAIRLLKPNDRPSDMVLLLLNGLKSNNEHFNDIVKSLRGSLKSPAHEDYVADKGLTELDLVRRYASTLKNTYVNLVQSKQWNVKSSSSGESFFPAIGAGSAGRQGGVSPPSNSDNQIIPPGYQKPRPAWQKWFRSSTCAHCGGPHPSKYHGDQGIYDRPFKPKQRPPSTKPKSGFNFKSKDSKTEFKKRVYQAMFDCMEDVDPDMMSLEEEFANVAEDDDEPPREEEDDEPTEEANIADDCDPAVMALAALGLKGLSLN